MCGVGGRVGGRVGRAHLRPVGQLVLSPSPHLGAIAVLVPVQHAVHLVAPQRAVHLRKRREGDEQAKESSRAGEARVTVATIAMKGRTPGGTMKKLSMSFMWLPG